MKDNEKFQKSITFSIAQMPHSENEHVAVVEVSVFDGQVMRTDIGVASAKSAKSSHGDVILNQARIDAEQRLMQGKNLLFAAQPMPLEEVQGYPPARRQSQQADTASRASMNGGGNKPATVKQKDMISNMCIQQGLNVEEVCQRFADTSLANLTGEGANAIIRRLKSE